MQRVADMAHGEVERARVHARVREMGDREAENERVETQFPEDTG